MLNNTTLLSPHGSPHPSVCENVSEHGAVVYGHDSGVAGPLNGPHLFIQTRGLNFCTEPDKRFENRNPFPIIWPPYCLN